MWTEKALHFHEFSLLQEISLATKPSRMYLIQTEKIYKYLISQGKENKEWIS